MSYSSLPPQINILRVKITVGTEEVLEWLSKNSYRWRLNRGKEKVSCWKEKICFAKCCWEEGLWYSESEAYVSVERQQRCVHNLHDRLVPRQHSLFHRATRTACSWIILMGGRSDRGDGCLPLESLADKDTSLSCKMTNYMFKVTNHLIKIYKRLNTVWPKWRQLPWINFGGGTQLLSTSIAQGSSAWTLPAFLMCGEPFAGCDRVRLRKKLNQVEK